MTTRATADAPGRARASAPFLYDRVRRLAAGRRFRFFVLGAVACVVAVVWIDRPLAFAIAAVIPPGKLVPNMPDVLVPLVAGVSLAAFLVWRSARARGYERLAHATLLVMSVGPVALGLKFLLKRVFGRPTVALVLAHPGIRGFHWLASHGTYDSFPSGHMLVATAWVAVVLGVYPRLRGLGWAALIVLAAALILGSFHFLGDVIAGAVLGAAVGWVALELMPVPSRASRSAPDAGKG